MSQKGDRREHILQAALQVISRHGLRKTTMEDIAEAAHMRAASIYYYFSNKEEVLGEAIRALGESYHTEIHAAVETGQSGREKLELYLEARRKIQARMDTSFDPTTEIAAELMPMVGKALAELMRTDLELIAKILQGGIEDGSLETDAVEGVATTIQACLLGAPLACQIHDFDRGLVSSTLGELLLRGLVSRAPLADKGGSR